MKVCLELFKDFYENKDKQYDYLNAEEKDAVNI